MVGELSGERNNSFLNRKIGLWMFFFSHTWSFLSKSMPLQGKSNPSAQAPSFYFSSASCIDRLMFRMLLKFLIGQFDFSFLSISGGRSIERWHHIRWLQTSRSISVA
jgi:hypothetical protein